MSKSESLIENLSKQNINPKKVSPGFLLAHFIVFFALFTFTTVAIRGLRFDIIEQLSSIHFHIEIVMSIAASLFSIFIAIELAIPDEKRCPSINFLPVIPIILIGYAILEGGNIGADALRESLKHDHFEITILLAFYTIPFAVLGFAFVKNLAPTKLGLDGFMIFLSSSSAAHFIVRITEPTDNIAPVFIWCYLPIILFSCMGIFLGKKILKW